MKGKVAIIGRPNVGKSKLFNYILGKRIAIVEDIPGVTRDRIMAEAVWQNNVFDLIDTAGYEDIYENDLEKNVQEQTRLAINIADVIVFVTDIKAGITELDKEIARLLQKSEKKVILAVNKCDSLEKDHLGIYEFYNLGLGEPLRLSVANGIGIGDLLDEIVNKLPKKEEEKESEERIKVALIGRPNVGKSSIVNKIVGENRSVVSNVAGTTRDAIDSDVTNSFGKYTFIDTAGLRKKSKILKEKLETYSLDRTNFAIERSDVCIFVLDAEQGVTVQDTKVLGLAHNLGKAIIIAVNKWDLIKKDEKVYNEFFKRIKNELSYANYAPIIFISAETGLRITKLFEEINKVYENSKRQIKTPVLNDIINEAMALHSPPSDKGKKLKIYYALQIANQPPTFKLHVNDKKICHYSYQRYIINTIRNHFDFSGTRINIILKEKGEEE